MLRRNVRGQNRLVAVLSNRLKSLQSVPIEFGDRPPVYVDLRHGQGWIWLKGSPWPTSPEEEDEQALIRKLIKPTDVVYDVGANIGLYASLFSRLAARVVAFEPNPKLFRTLTLTTANLANVEALPVALSDTNGSATLYVPNDDTMGSLADYTRADELREWKEGIGLSPADQVECETATLDSLIDSGMPRPDFIKCDVEGAELLVFRGARKMLSSSGAPFVLFEVLEMCSNGFGVDLLAAAHFLKDLRFDLFSLHAGGRLKPMVAIAALPAGQRASILAVPHGRRNLVSLLIY